MIKKQIMMNLDITPYDKTFYKTCIYQIKQIQICMKDLWIDYIIILIYMLLM